MIDLTMPGASWRPSRHHHEPARRQGPAGSTTMRKKKKLGRNATTCSSSSQGAHGPELLAPLARGRRAAAEVLGAAHQARVLPRVPKSKCDA